MMESKMGDIDNSNSIHIIPNIIALIAGITISMGMVYLPLYGYDLGANEVIVGLIASSQSLTYIFASFFIGRFSDSIGTKKALLFGTGILAVLYALYFVVSNPYLFIPLKAIEGVGFAFIWPSLQAYFGESRKELRVYNIMWCSGVTFSPFIGGFIVQLFGLKYVFIPPMLLLALSFAFGLALSSDNKKEHKSPSKKALNENGRKEIRIFLFPFIYGFILLTISTFFPIYAGSNGIAAIQTGYLLALWNFGRILSFILPDRVHRIFGRSVELLILTIASGFLSSLIAFQNQIVFLILELFSLGLIPGLVFSSMQYKILQIDKERRGFYAGILESIIMIGAFLATFIGGFVASGNLTGVFFLPIIFSLFVLILYLLMHRIN